MFDVWEVTKPFYSCTSTRSPCPCCSGFHKPEDEIEFCRLRRCEFTFGHDMTASRFNFGRADMNHICPLFMERPVPAPGCLFGSYLCQIKLADWIMHWESCCESQLPVAHTFSVEECIMVKLHGELQCCSFILGVTIYHKIQIRCTYMTFCHLATSAPGFLWNAPDVKFLIFACDGYLFKGLIGWIFP